MNAARGLKKYQGNRSSGEHTPSLFRKSVGVGMMGWRHRPAGVSVIDTSFSKGSAPAILPHDRDSD
jgi:hypothetical protein